MGRFGNYCNRAVAMENQHALRESIEANKERNVYCAGQYASEHACRWTKGFFFNKTCLFFSFSEGICLMKMGSLLFISLNNYEDL